MFYEVCMIVTYLEKVRQKMYEQKVNLEREYQNNEILLKENIQFVHTLEKSLDKNYESFSPRGVNKESYLKIDSLKKEHLQIEEEGKELKLKIFQLNAELDELESILKVARENEKIVENKDTPIEEDEFFRRKILETQEMERQRIARDLHDFIIQSLTNMVHKVELCSKLMDVDIVRCKLEMQAMSKSIRNIINDMRRVIYDLRPMSMDDIGLNVTLERELSKMHQLGMIKINYEIKGTEQKIAPIISLTILRIVQEACNNILKHANAKNVNVVIKYEVEQLVLEISDDGIGFQLESVQDLNKKDGSGFGLSMMKERVYLLSGKLQIVSEPEKGTRILVKVPINKEEI